MVGEAPVVYLLHGEDEFGIAHFLSELSARLGDAATASMNTTRLDGSATSLEELRGATFALPFRFSFFFTLSFGFTGRCTSPAPLA